MRSIQSADLAALEFWESNAEGILQALNDGVMSITNGVLSAAASVILLYIVSTIIRNVIEPKLVGKQVGLHPMLALATMLIGLKFFGLLGMPGLPILLSFLKILYDKRQMFSGQPL